MERFPEALPELTNRLLRQWYVAYRKDSYPRYGEGRLPQLSYLGFKTKVLEHRALHRKLVDLYERHPQASQAPADARALMVHLEAQTSRLEQELCLS